MELRSRVLAEVETGDSHPGVPGPSSLMTEISGEPVPESVPSPSSIADVARTSLSHPDTAGLMGATLRAPIAGCSQMLGSIGTVVNPDVHADVEVGPVLALEAGSEARPTQPPHPLLIVDVPSGYQEDLETFGGTPDTVYITDILSVDVTPLASGVHATSCPDLSVAKPMSIDPSAYCIVAESGARREFRSPSMSVDFDDRSREIRDPSTSTSVDDLGAYCRIRNPSLVISTRLQLSKHDVNMIR